MDGEPQGASGRERGESREEIKGQIEQNSNRKEPTWRRKMKVCKNEDEVRGNAES